MDSPKYNSNEAKEKWLNPSTISPVLKRTASPKSFNIRKRRYKGVTTRKNYINTPRYKKTKTRR